MTKTKKTATRGTVVSAKPTTMPQEIGISRFSVSTEWVKITLNVDQKTAEFIAIQSPDLIRTFSESVWNAALSGKRDESSIDQAQASLHEAPAGILATIHLSMEAMKWDIVVVAAESIGASTAAFIRAALAFRMQEIHAYRRKTA